MVAGFTPAMLPARGPHGIGITRQRFRAAIVLSRSRPGSGRWPQGDDGDRRGTTCKGIIIEGSGHFIAEEAPDAMLAALTTFVAPYRQEVTA